MYVGLIEARLMLVLGCKKKKKKVEGIRERELAVNVASQAECHVCLCMFAEANGNEFAQCDIKQQLSALFMSSW